MTTPTSDRKVFLGMPGYGQLTAGASRGFWRATRLPDSQVSFTFFNGSLLALNFNSLWCSALNQRLTEDGPNYFAMQHADVEPSDYWLDDLIDELEANDLDILGVSVPIKSERGLTSLAVDRRDGDTWRPLCRLSTTEVASLPETFTSKDVGGNLLINTGLWVCRFNPDWARKVRFTINDRIVFDSKAGKYIPQVEPEDWYFSRLCHELGLRIGATRKIVLTHRGDAAYPNNQAWGDPFDSAWLNQSVIPSQPHIGD